MADVTMTDANNDPVERITCWICFEIYKQPVILPCGHSYCKECAAQVLKQSGLCGYCRSPFSVVPEVSKPLISLVESTLTLIDAKMRPQPLPIFIDQSGAFILRLPKDPLWETFSHLGARDLARSARVCKYFRSVSNDPLLWRWLCQNSFPFCSVEKYNNNWKHCYIARTQITSNWETGKPNDFELTSMRGHKNYITTFQLYRNRLVSGAADNVVKIWKLGTSTAIHSLQGHNAPITSLQFNDFSVISSSMDTTIKWWDSNQGSLISSISHGAPITQILNDGNLVISSATDNDLKVWDSRSQQIVRTLTGHTSPIHSMQLSGSQVIAASSDDLKIWDIGNGSSISTAHPGTESFVCVGGTGATTTKIVASTNRGHISLWNGNSWNNFSGSSSGTFNLKLRFDGKDRIVAAGHDGSITTFSLSKKSFQKKIAAHSATIYDCPISDSGRLVTCSADGSIKVWNMSKYENKSSNEVKPLYALLSGSQQQRADNPEHPQKPGYNGIAVDDSRIIASTRALIRSYDFEVYKPVK